MAYQVDVVSDVPPSRQLVEQVLDRVATGRLAPGAQLPSVRALAAESLVNPNTAAKAVRRFCSTARRHGVESLDVFLTAPGRQSANADELVAALQRAADHPVRVLSTEEEGRLAYAGAVAVGAVVVAKKALSKDEDEFEYTP
jgi:DNA-binding transcriptional regulator YhcF (GntR family)